MFVNKMLNALRLFIGTLLTVGIIFCLLMAVDARNLEHKLLLDSSNRHEKKIEFKQGTSAGEKLLHHIRLKRSQGDDRSCRKHVASEFMRFTRSFRAMGSKYQDLFKNTFNLKCIYVSIILLVLFNFVLGSVRSVFNFYFLTAIWQLK